MCLTRLQDLLKADESPAFDPVLTHFHTGAPEKSYTGSSSVCEADSEGPKLPALFQGAILGMDVCIRKPLVVTCGVDKSARVWNYVEKTCALCKWFNEEAYSIAFHPSGFHLIIGQSDKLRLMNLLMEDMKTYKDIPIKQCRECRFSNGGQYFAAVNTNATNAIQVYKTYTCEPIETLRGHNNKVRSVAWTQDDSMLVSTGADGAVYEYYVQAETIPGREGRRAAFKHESCQTLCPAFRCRSLEQLRLAMTLSKKVPPSRVSSSTQIWPREPTRCSSFEHVDRMLTMYSLVFA